MNGGAVVARNWILKITLVPVSCLGPLPQLAPPYRMTAACGDFL